MKKGINKIKTIVNDFLQRQGVEHPEVQWLIKVQTLLVIFITSVIALLFSNKVLVAYVIGALLTYFNFFVLARTVPKLIFVRKGAVFNLLVVYYMRLMFTAVILFIAIAGIKLPAVSLLIGLSTLLITFIMWFGKYLMIYKNKEAQIDVS